LAIIHANLKGLLAFSMLWVSVFYAGCGLPRVLPPSRDSTTRFCILLDTSGSMERIDVSRILRECKETLERALSADDDYTIIQFARTPKVVIPFSKERPSGKEVPYLIPHGSTDLREALLFAKLVFQESQGDVGSDRRHLILISDGDFWYFDDNRIVGELRKIGVTISTICIASDPTLGSERLRGIARKGGGRTESVVPGGFSDTLAKEIASTLGPAVR